MKAGIAMRLLAVAVLSVGQAHAIYILQSATKSFFY
jgi:hypothetical protein